MTSAHDAIVILGCRVTAVGQPSKPLGRRVAAGAQAYREGRAPRVIVSGGRRWGGHLESRAMRQALVASGVPDEAITEEMCSLSTFENAVFTSALLQASSYRRVAPRALVVTCSWHMDRALASFRALGVEADPCPAEPPHLSLVTRVRIAIHEAVCKRLDARAVRRASRLSGLASLLAGAVSHSGGNSLGAARNLWHRVRERAEAADAVMSRSDNS